MNEKIAEFQKKFTMSTVRQEHGRQGGGTGDIKRCLLTGSIAKAHKISGGRHAYCLQLSLHARLLRKLGWAVPCDLDMIMDYPNVLVKPCNNGVLGYRLNKTDATGSTRPYVRFTLYDALGWPHRNVTVDACTCVEAEDGVLACVLPQTIQRAVNGHFVSSGHEG